MKTREHLSFAPDGSAVVFTQELRDDGSWYNRSARRATEQDLLMNNGITGSSNSHARLAPSGSKQWYHCTASIAFTEANAHRVRKDTGSAYSDFGTEAHEWAAKVLLKQIEPGDVPEEFKECVDPYVAHCVEASDGASYEVEVEVPLFYQEAQTGTCDFACITEDRVVIRDLKAGQGVLVTSESNTQLAIYAYSLVKLYEDLYAFGPDTVVDIHAFQPRHREGADQKPWIITLADLATFCKDIEYRAIQARNAADRVRAKIGSPGRDVSPEEILEAAPGAVFHPSEGDGGSCRWCAMKYTCPKRLSAALEDLDTPNLSAEDMLASMPDLDKPEKKEPVAERVRIVSERVGLPVLSDDYLVSLFRRSKAITTFLSDVAEYLEGRALDGEEIPGVKLAMGREGNRQWADEAAADTFLSGQKIPVDDRYTKKLISPTQAENLLKGKLKTRAQNRFDELVTRSPARQVLVLSDDKRPAVAASVAALPDLECEFE